MRLSSLENSIALGPSKAAQIRLFCASLFVGLPCLYYWLLALDYRYGPGLLFEGLFVGTGMSDLGIFCFLLLGAAVLAAPLLLFRLRQRRPAAVVWDDWGLTEWDGDSVRAAIPWAEASCYRGSFWQHAKRGSRYVRRQVGEVLQISGRGARITLFSGAGEPRWMYHRRMQAEDLSALKKAAAALPAAEALVPEPGARPGGSFFRLAGFLGYGCFIARYNYTLSGLTQLLLIYLPFDLVALSVFCLIARAGKPFQEWQALRAEERRLAPARRLSLQESRGTRIVARDEAGRAVELETAGLAHPDAQIGTRRGDIWVIFSEAGPAEAGPFRSSGRQEALALETGAARESRRALQRAVFLELAARVAIALLVAWVSL